MLLASSYTLAASLIWGVNTLFLLNAGLSIGEVFVANAAFSAGMVLFEIPTGVVADTLGRRTSYLLSVSILGATTILYLVAAELEAGVVVFVLVSILMGLGFTFYSGALEAWLVDGLQHVGDHEQLDHVFARGNQVSGTAMFVGTIGGGFLGQLDLAIPFIARAALLLVVFLGALYGMHDIGFEPKELKAREIPTQMRRQAAVGIAHGWGQPGLRLLMISGSIRGLFFGWAFYASQPYFLELLERDAVWVVGLVTAGVSLALIIGNQIVEVATRRCGHRTTLLIYASATSTVASIVIGITSTFAVAVVCLLIVAGSMGVIMPVRQAYLHKVTESEHRATVVSFDAMITSVGGASGQVGLGTVSDARSLSAGYVVGGVATVFALPALFMLRRLGSNADNIPGPKCDVAESTIPAGLPRATGVEAHPIPVVTDR
jgi:MFS family permease